MSYTPQTWANGDIITATKLNNIESGVQSVSNSYTPTTWVNGDIITAVKLNNIEQGIANAGGGGGSSDFSTAEVTFINNTVNEISILCCVAKESPIPLIPATSESMIYLDSNTSEVVTAILYKGHTSAGVVGDVTLSASGNADVSADEATITGDCTITIS